MRNDIDCLGRNRGERVRRKNQLFWIVLTALVFFVTVFALPRLLSAGESRFRSRVGENLYSLELELLNDTLAETFPLLEGDAVEVSLTRLSGELTISIGQENREPVYEGRNPPLGSFRVTIPEDGDYIFSVGGKNAAGSVSFQINRLKPDEVTP